MYCGVVEFGGGGEKRDVTSVTLAREWHCDIGSISSAILIIRSIFF